MTKQARTEKAQPVQVSRVKRSRRETRRAYDRLSRWYDLLEGNFERKPRMAGVRRLAVREGEHVLEIGSGTGVSLISLARSVKHTGRVYAVDLSCGMLNVTRKRVREAGLSSSVRLVCGDAAMLPFRDGCMDAIYMSFVLELFDTPDIPVVLQECARVLREGGRLCVVSLSKEDGDTVPVRLYEWFHRRFPAIVDCRPILAGRSVRRSGLGIVRASTGSVWGLPVEIVLARKP